MDIIGGPRLEISRDRRRPLKIIQDRTLSKESQCFLEIYIIIGEATESNKLEIHIKSHNLRKKLGCDNMFPQLLINL